VTLKVGTRNALSGNTGAGHSHVAASSIPHSLLGLVARLAPLLRAQGGTDIRLPNHLAAPLRQRTPGDVSPPLPVDNLSRTSWLYGGLLTVVHTHTHTHTHTQVDYVEAFSRRSSAFCRRASAFFAEGRRELVFFSVAQVPAVRAPGPVKNKNAECVLEEGRQELDFFLLAQVPAVRAPGP